MDDRDYTPFARPRPTGPANADEAADSGEPLAAFA